MISLHITVRLQLVYLTAESPNVLEDLDKSKVRWRRELNIDVTVQGACLCRSAWSLRFAATCVYEYWQMDRQIHTYGSFVQNRKYKYFLHTDQWYRTCMLSIHLVHTQQSTAATHTYRPCMHTHIPSHRKYHTNDAIYIHINDTMYIHVYTHSSIWFQHIMRIIHTFVCIHSIHT